MAQLSYSMWHNDSNGTMECMWHSDRLELCETMADWNSVAQWQ